ncbi:unnamed protein product, partial [Adineta steineri]
GETTVTLQETICTEVIVEISNAADDSSAEIEKFCTWARFTPSDPRTERRLLSARTREELKTHIDESKDYAVGDRWSKQVIENMNVYYTVTRIYDNEEYDTEVITFDEEYLMALDVLGYGATVHMWLTREVDIETGILLFLETIIKTTNINDRKTETDVKKLIKQEKAHHEL